MDLETPLEHYSLGYFGLGLLLSESLGSGSCSLLELSADAFNAGNSTPCNSVLLLLCILVCVRLLPSSFPWPFPCLSVESSMLDWNAFTVDLRLKKKRLFIGALSLGSTHGLHLVCFTVVMVNSNTEVGKMAWGTNICSSSSCLQNKYVSVTLNSRM